MNEIINPTDAVSEMGQAPIPNAAPLSEPADSMNDGKTANIGIPGRRVSRAEVIRFVDEMLRKAEEARIVAAELEAERYFDMESSS